MIERELKVFFLTGSLFLVSEVSHNLLIAAVGSGAISSMFAVVSRVAIYFFFGIFSRRVNMLKQASLTLALVLWEYITLGAASVAVVAASGPEFSFLEGFLGLIASLPLVLLLAFLIVFLGRLSGLLFCKGSSE